jgi:hypothetical protein
MRSRPIIFSLATIAFVVVLASAQSQTVPARFTEDLLEGFEARALGPYRAGSWVTSWALPAGPAREHH